MPREGGASSTPWPLSITRTSLEWASAWGNKYVVVTLVERGGSVPSFHVDGVRVADIQPIIRANCKEKHLHRYLCEFDFRYSNCVALGVDDVARPNAR